jgi:hypothetical protein
LLPTIIAAFTAPIDVPATMSILTFFFTNALNTPHAKAPNEPYFSIASNNPSGEFGVDTMTM